MVKYYKKIFYFLTLFLFTFSFGYSLNSNIVEKSYLVNNKIKEPCNGYTLICRADEKTFLIDMAGNIIHNYSLDGYPAKMLPGGSIIGGLEDYDNINEKKHIVQEDWNGSIVWDFYNWDNGSARQHHDFEREGNPVGYYAPDQDFVEKGKTLVLAYKTLINTSISKWPLDDEIIYEVDWNGNLTDFQWYANDHFNELGFDMRAKFGIYYQKLIYTMRSTIKGWLHINSLSELGENHWYEEGDTRFNPKNLIITSRHANFIAIIDRNTGKIVWRVGPDYSKNTKEGQKLGQIIGPHLAHMIPKGLPGEGNILVFDNGGFGGYGILGLPCRFIRFYSRVIEFNPITYNIVWEYSKKNGSLFSKNEENKKFFSYIMSSAQRLPNGNTLIAEATKGRVFEVTSDNEIVWEYFLPRNPVHKGLYQVYRAYRIPPEWVPGNPAGYTPWE
ncbi:MAG: arylsulfotransferase family protein [Candidatus Thermoplasmatota archaeon]|nr:arylsulfotransferase family protein [Candidatus Thermoplasmatota archaeon]